MQTDNQAIIEHRFIRDLKSCGAMDSYKDDSEKQHIARQIEKAFRDSFCRAVSEAAALDVNPDDPFGDIQDRLGLKAAEKQRNFVRSGLFNKKLRRFEIAAYYSGKYARLDYYRNNQTKAIRKAMRSAYWRGRVHALSFIEQAYGDSDFPGVSPYNEWGYFHENLIQPWHKRVKAWAKAPISDRLVCPPDLIYSTYLLAGKLTEQSKHRSGRHIKMIPLHDVEAKPLEWLWHNRFPAKMVNVLAGEAGVGKSYLSLYMATQLTTGGDWPDCENMIEPGTVLLFTDEESLEYAVKPRLEAHGADCSKVLAFDCIQTGDDEESQESFALDTAIKELEDLLETIPDCRLIIFDPINSYLGEIKENSNKEVRQGLTKLSRIADKWDVTILCITHLNKKWDISTMHRVMGSTAFTSVARAVWCVRFDEVDEERDEEPPRLFAHVKSNFCNRPTALRYHIVDNKVQFLEGQERINIDSLIQKAKKTGGKKASKKEAITAWLKERIGDEPVLADELKAEARGRGFNWRYVQYISNDLGIHKEKSEAHGNKSVWMKETDE